MSPCRRPFYLTAFVLTILVCYGAQRLRNTENFFDHFEIPKVKPVGLDLGVVLDAGRAFLNGSTNSADYAVGHPPFELFSLLPLATTSQHRAFMIFGSILIACLWGMIYFSLRAGGAAEPSESVFLSSVLTLVLFHTYPVLFAIERGNTDLIAGFFMALFLFGLKKQKAILSATSLFLAVHYKIYPIILLPFFFFQFGFRKTLAEAALIFGGFFVLGLAPLKGFHQSILRLQNSPGAWYGNHALKSWATYQHGWAFNFKTEQVDQLRILLAIIFIFALILYSTKKSKIEAKAFGDALVCMAFPLMSLLPGTSHDYRIPIYLIPLLLLISNREIRGWGLAALSIMTGLLFSSFGFLISKTEILLVLYGVYILVFASQALETEKKRRLSMNPDTCTP